MNMSEATKIRCDHQWSGIDKKQETEWTEVKREGSKNAIECDNYCVKCGSYQRYLPHGHDSEIREPDRYSLALVAARNKWREARANWIKSLREAEK